MNKRFHVSAAIIGMLLVSLAVPLASSTQDCSSIQVIQGAYIAHLPLSISDESDFITYGFDGDGTPQNPYIIEGLNITRFGTCISMDEIDVYFVIRNCFFKPSESMPAISIQDCRNGVVSNCWIEDASIGILLRWSSNMIVSDNIIVSGGVGISTNNGFNHTYTGNIIAENSFGCDLNDHNSILLKNRIYSNERTGLTLDAGAYNNTITDNILGWNRGYLILTGGIDAIDDGSSNQWSDNFYSQYSGTGNYSISGDASSVDEYPKQLVDNTAPSLRYQERIILTSDTPQFNLTFVERFPLRYNITVEGLLVAEGYCFENLTGIPLSGISLGVHNMTISLVDGARNEASFVIEIEIVTEVDILPTIYASIGIVIIVSIIISLEILRRRK